MYDCAPVYTFVCTFVYQCYNIEKCSFKYLPEVAPKVPRDALPGFFSHYFLLSLFYVVKQAPSI